MNTAAAAPVESPVVSSTPTVEQLQAELAALQAKLKAAAPPEVAVEAPPAFSMTVEEAKAHIASFANKRGRRPASFYMAEDLVKNSMTPEEKEALKLAAKTAAQAEREERKAAKVAKKAAKVYAQAVALANKALEKTEKAANTFTKLEQKSAKLVEKAKKLNPSPEPEATVETPPAV